MSVAAPELTDEQLAVVKCDSNCFVNACPGAGKTRTLAYAFVRAARDLPRGHGVAVLSFSRCAADEVRTRCSEIGRPDLMGFPHFIDTFDAFIARYLVAPFGSRYAPDIPVQIIDTWDRRGVNVIVQGAGGRKMPVPLSAFRVTGPTTVELDEHRLQPSIKRFATEARQLANRAAERRREQLLRLGLLTCEDARVLAGERVRDPRGKKIVSALSARFRVLFVDEAQDCNPADVEIVDALRESGTRVVLVADLEQAIYRFRGAQPSELNAWKVKLPNLTLTRNFRSTQVICSAASSLKSRPQPDQAAGRYASEPTPVVLIPYDKLSTHVGETFSQSAVGIGIAQSDAVVLAYREEHAAAAVGVDLGGSSSSRLVRLANAVRLIRTGHADASDTAAAVETVEEVLLARLKFGGVAAAEIRDDSSRARWLRAEAYGLLCALVSRPVVDTEQQRWVAMVHEQLSQANVPPWGVEYALTPKQVLRDSGWSPSDATAVPISPMTIHKSKGREFDAVLLVLPPGGRTNETLDAWEQRADAEARSVMYVGATRARRLLGFAVPSQFAERVETLIVRDGGVCERIALAQSEPRSTEA